MISTQSQPVSSNGAALSGLRVAVARAQDDAKELAALLEANGAEIVYYPCVEIVPFAENEEFDEALTDAAAGKYDWLVLNDADTVIVLAEQLERLGLDPRALNKMKVATIGCMTEQNALQYLGLQSDFAPTIYTPEIVAEAMKLNVGDRVFLPQSAVTRMALAKCLRNTGADVNAVNAYRTIIGRGGDPAPVMLWEGQIDVVAFTYPTEVRYFAKRLKYEGGSLAMLDDVVVACIGPITAEAARSYGFNVAPVPPQHTFEGLVQMIGQVVSA